MLTNERAYYLCQLAKLGEREAANELAELVRRWVFVRAYAIARRVRQQPEDLASIMFFVLPACISAYRAERGSFMNYFAHAASRYLNKCLAELPSRAADLAAVAEPAWMPSETDLAARELQELLAILSPLERAIVTKLNGIDGPAMGVKRLARKLGLRPQRLRSIYKLACARMKEGVK